MLRLRLLFARSRRASPKRGLLQISILINERKSKQNDVS